LIHMNMVHLKFVLAEFSKIIKHTYKLYIDIQNLAVNYASKQ